jgi:S-ribosylhomocysteine lyase LuxS involved in autoinducer biosynthesis
MADVHGIEFSSTQSDLVKGLIRELLKDGNCAVYGLPHMKPNGELRMACTPPIPGPRHQRGVFLRICHGKIAAIAIRPMHARTGAEQISITKYNQQELLETIRSWRKEVSDTMPEPPVKVELPKAA